MLFLQSLQSGGKRHLGNVIDEQMQDKVQRGLCTAQNAVIQKACLRGWLADPLEEGIGRIASKRAAACYEQLVNTPTRKTKQPPTAATHRFYLNLAQTRFRWAVRQGYIRESPFAEIQPAGRPNRGKKQLRSDAPSASSPSPSGCSTRTGR